MERLTELPIWRDRQSKSIWLILALLVVLFMNLVIPDSIQALPFDPDAYYDGNTYYYDNKVFERQATVEAGSIINSDQKMKVDYTYYFVQINDVFQLIRPDNIEQPTTARYLKLSYDLATNQPLKILEAADIKVNLVQDNSSKRTCEVPYVGWILCPIVNAMSSAVDWLYEVISQTLVTGAIDVSQTDKNPIYVSWSAIRNIANIVFVISFLIIIASHLSGFGLSNYHIKKLFPKLIIISIMVNLSFIISATAVDISNILGASIKDLFVLIQKQTMGASALSQANSISWSALLGMTTLGSAAGVGILAMNGGWVGAIMLIGLALLNVMGVLVGIIFALAARQAIIVILVVISPLAFVASILPNTESLFKKWYNTFIKMASLYPAFAFIYGSAVLTSSLILSTAEGDWLRTLLGLIVRVVPFLLLFQLIKSADAVLDKVSNSATNSANGLAEGASSFLKRKLEIQKENYVGGQRLTGISSFTRPKGLAQRFARGKKMDEWKLEEAKNKNKAMFEEMGARKDAGGMPLGSMAKQAIRTRAAEDEVQAYTAKRLVTYQAYKSKVMEQSNRYDDNLDIFREGSVERQIAQSSLVKQIATTELKSMTGMQEAVESSRVINDITLPYQLNYGSGVTIRQAIAGINPQYSKVLLTDVLTIQRKQKAEMIDMATALLKQTNLSENEAYSLATQKDFANSKIISELKASKNNMIERTGKDGVKYTIDLNDDALRYASALAIGSAPRGDLHEGLQEATLKGGALEGFREEIAGLIYKSGVGVNAMMGIKTPDYINQGKFRGVDTYYEVEAENIIKGRYSIDKIVKQDKDAMERMMLGLQELADGKSIQLAEPDTNGNIVTMNLLQYYSKLAGGRQLAYDQMKRFREDLARALTDPEVSRQLQSAQKDRMESMITSLNQVIPD